MRYRVAVDTGGTFTDLVVVDEGGSMTINKAPTTPGRVFNGILAALDVTASELGLSTRELLRGTEIFLYATTLATNAIVEGKTARTAFLTTEGFPDILLYREGGRLNPFSFREPYPPPYIPRRLTYEIRERISSEGEVITPLDEGQALDQLQLAKKAGVEAIAICLLWSFVRGEHEERLSDLIEAELPGIPYTLSHRLNPIPREYRRASSTAIDASLKPLIQEHLRTMEADLREAGFDGQLLIVTSSGGVMEVQDASNQPVYLVNSGPSMSPVAGQAFAEHAQHSGDVIVCDTGGTSFDVGLISAGVIAMTRESWLGGQWTGHLTGLSSVATKSIGAGGGSIAWVDSGGLLRVGPDSAGAEPGPACYDQGGTSPTVTDAAVVAGYLNPDNFLGGRKRLQRSLAEQALQQAVALPLELTVPEAAVAVLVVARERMVTAIQEITVSQGLDPRECLLVAGGGAAGMNIVSIARELGLERVLIPKAAPALSAVGAQLSDIVAEFNVSRATQTNAFDATGINDCLEQLDARMRSFFDGLTVTGKERTALLVEARYPYQVWELEVPLPASRIDSDARVGELEDAFHKVHQRILGVHELGQYIECVTWKGRAQLELKKPKFRRHSVNSPPQPTPQLVRTVYFDAGVVVEAGCFDGRRLSPGMVIDGPAVVEEPLNTIIIPGYARGIVTETFDYLVELNQEMK